MSDEVHIRNKSIRALPSGLCLLLCDPETGPDVFKPLWYVDAPSYPRGFRAMRCYFAISGVRQEQRVTARIQSEDVSARLSVVLGEARVIPHDDPLRIFSGSMPLVGLHIDKPGRHNLALCSESHDIIMQVPIYFRIGGAE